MKITSDQLHQVGAILRQAAVEEIMPRFRHLSRQQVQEKSSIFDLVTEGDEAAERLITRELLAAFPEGIVIGEEEATRDPSLLERIADAPLAFIVDPIDGTRNFATNLPVFGVMAAITSEGQVIGSVIMDPVCGDIAYALEGEGAWLEDEEGTSVPLSVGEGGEVNTLVGMISTGSLTEPERSEVNGRLSALGMIQLLRCAAHDYRQAAQGFSQVLFYNKLMPWDHAAGWLLHKEAGGYSAHLDGTPYRPTQLSGGLLCAPDEATWHAVRDALFDRHRT
ncbi:inositol monophosphatase family protein [Larsenimonas rhizosphaerae]|uniref:Inositol monophosphatase n=1 Tax=Larsenimonas rhizosphaerae TaxID=2944682 RepID=A0AA41ZGR4_9GAMM|nr:inositol monophosphatase [Larsenimonas rhizosphaerae]MCM2129797.1 inositol monophosphatase [Larsenimonas rhizosphaerae]MCX2524457.1 inositol monophosphatase [Larsenimonas rhizosphaerae]